MSRVIQTMKTKIPRFAGVEIRQNGFIVSKDTSCNTLTLPA